MPGDVRGLPLPFRQPQQVLQHPLQHRPPGRGEQVGMLQWPPQSAADQLLGLAGPQGRPTLVDINQLIGRAARFVPDNKVPRQWNPRDGNPQSTGQLDVDHRQRQRKPLAVIEHLVEIAV